MEERVVETCAEALGCCNYVMDRGEERGENTLMEELGRNHICREATQHPCRFHISIKPVSKNKSIK